jgi:putative ubiquitin-RnfH superfamily antitoxin RatB of RatAB toxin-antitoxin module
MPDLLDRDTRTAIRVDGDERLARAELRRQIGRLEHQLGSLVAEAFPRLRIDAAVPAVAAAPRALDLGDLEAIRDSLATQIGIARRQLRERAELETRNRELLERMLADPAEHRWLRISRADVGEPGCGHWHSRPRLGPLGMLMGWWRVKISSGCPLPGRLAAVERAP